MKKYKVVEKKPINKHKHKLDKYTAYIDVLEKLLAKMDCNDEKIQKYNDLIVSLMQKKEKYKEKILCVNAIEMAYDISNDDRLFDVGELMNTTFNFFANNTSLSREEIKQKVNNNLVDVLIEEEFPDNPTGVGYYNSEFGEMALRADQIKSEEIKLLLRHELTHVLGTQVVKGIVASGYSRSYNEDSVKLLTIKQKETIFSKLQRKVATMFNKQKKNNQFNEACVEMFAHKDVPLQTKSTYSIWFFEKNLNTNFSTGSFYIYNANFVREMIIAAGISEDELFKGLFDYKSSEKVMKKFGSKTFKTISNNMEKLYSELTAYNTFIEGLFDKYYDSSMQEDDEIFKRCTTDEIKKKDEAIMKIEKRMASIEKNIIDKILLKRIKKLSAEERKRVVGGFSKFVICERDYFEKVTGFKYEQDASETEHARISQYRVEVGDLSIEKAKTGEKSSFKNSDELEK